MLMKQSDKDNPAEQPYTKARMFTMASIALVQALCIFPNPTYTPCCNNNLTCMTRTWYLVSWSWIVGICQPW